MRALKRKACETGLRRYQGRWRWRRRRGLDRGEPERGSRLGLYCEPQWKPPQIVNDQNQ